MTDCDPKCMELILQADSLMNCGKDEEAYDIIASLFMRKAIALENTDDVVTNDNTPTNARNGHKNKMTKSDSEEQDKTLEMQILRQLDQVISDDQDEDQHQYQSIFFWSR